MFISGQFAWEWRLQSRGDFKQQSKLWSVRYSHFYSLQLIQKPSLLKLTLVLAVMVFFMLVHSTGLIHFQVFFVNRSIFRRFLLKESERSFISLVTMSAFWLAKVVSDRRLTEWKKELTLLWRQVISEVLHGAPNSSRNRAVGSLLTKTHQTYSITIWL